MRRSTSEERGEERVETGEILADADADAVDAHFVTTVPPGFELLFRRWFGPLVRTLSRISPDAQDAVQEAFVEAHARWEVLEGYDDAAAWVRRVAINRLLDAERRRRGQSRLVHRLGQARSPRSSSGQPLEIGAALECLPLRQRLVIGLFYFDDMSIEQIATAMSVTPGTIKSALHHGRKNLKRLLEAPNERDE